MKTALICPCGEHLRASDDDALVTLVQQHLTSAHPGLEYSREEILSVAV